MSVHTADDRVVQIGLMQYRSADGVWLFERAGGRWHVFLAETGRVVNHHGFQTLDEAIAWKLGAHA